MIFVAVRKDDPKAAGCSNYSDCHIKGFLLSGKLHATASGLQCEMQNVRVSTAERFLLRFDSVLWAHVVDVSGSSSFELRRGVGFRHFVARRFTRETARAEQPVVVQAF